MKTQIRNTKDQQKPATPKVVPEPVSVGTATLEDNRPATVVQRKLQAGIHASSSQKQFSIQRKANNTGLPGNLKPGIENLSGFAMDDVKVHYNSAKPAQLKAHAYAQGSDIHLAPGQEKHLPHEAWHVVQQKQGRVQPTRQLKSKVAINDDAGLEKEADTMGEKALKVSENNPATSSLLSRPANTGVHQLKIYNNIKTKYNWQVKSLEKLQTVLLGKDLEGVEQWKVTMINEFWDLYGGTSKVKAYTKTLQQILEEKEETAHRAFDYFKAGAYLQGGTIAGIGNLGIVKENRAHLGGEFRKTDMSKAHPWLEPMVHEMRGNVLAMMDDLIVSFYYNGEADQAITDSGALMSSRQRDKAASGGVAADSKTPTVDKDLHNDDFVFGFMEHKKMLPKGDTRFAAPSTKTGAMEPKKSKLDMRKGMRISRPLRWYLNQPGALIQLGDLIKPRPRDDKKGLHPMSLPDFIIGMVEGIDGAQLKAYPEVPSGKDKATMMLEDMFESIKEKLFSQVSWGNPNVALRDGIFNERAFHVQSDYLHNVKVHEGNPARYFDVVIRKYAQAQVLIPEKISHKEGEMTKIKLEDFYNFQEADTDGRFPKPEPKAEADLERKLSNISLDSMIPEWPKA